MIRWIVGTSLRFRFIVCALGLGLMVLWIATAEGHPDRCLPGVRTPKGRSADLVSGAFAGGSGGTGHGADRECLERRSRRRDPSIEFGSATLLRHCDFLERGTDALTARQLVTERVAIATRNMPTWAAPPVMMPPVSSTSRVMKIGVSSKTRSMMDLSMLAYWQIRSRLLSIPGVANVAIWGEQLKMLRVQVDPERLAELNLTLDHVMETTSDALEVGLLRYSGGAHIGTGGFIDTGAQRLPIHHILSSSTPETLAQVSVAERDGKRLVLGDVVQLVWAAGHGW